MDKMTMHDLKRALLDAARSIKEHGPSDPKCGLCHNIARALPEQVLRMQFRPLLRSLFQRWPEFSGDEDYPVPSEDERDADEAYNRMGSLYVGEYGASRMALLNFIIEKLEAEVQDA